MNNFEEVCLKSCESWIDSFPQEVPEHNFSQEHINKLNSVLAQKQTNNKTKISKKTFKFLLIAAILLSLTTTAFAISQNREYIIDKFFNHSEYNVVDTKNAKIVKSLNVNYIPTGFEKTDSSDSYVCYTKGTEIFTVEKNELSATIYFDTDHHDAENIKINCIDAVYFRCDIEEKGIIFNDGNYIYTVSGNIEKDELVKIAQNAK